MATTKTIQATVKNRTDTAANWTQKNPVLAKGEIIVVQTSAGETRLKIGDGVKTFTQLPYTDEQIYNNVVTSVNGQTGDITTNSVEYTVQTLTDEQKKQARENIGAEEMYGGLKKVNLKCPSILTTRPDVEFAAFVETGDIKPYPDDASNDIKRAYTVLQLIFASSLNAPGESYVKWLTEGMAKAYQQGLIEVPLYCYGESYNNSIKRVYAYANDATFEVKARLWNGSSFDYGYKFADGSFEFGSTLGRPISANTSTVGGEASASQFSMASAPTTDMQIATKKYVDNKISDKELVLSSSTAGSTKKFKLTIDDTGTLTASEITA